jgi:GDPmannose 4,6-dehydratase
LYRDPTKKVSIFILRYGDSSDVAGLLRILERVRPDEVYNLSAQSHVRVSFDQPEYTVDIVATGTLRLLEAVREYVTRTGSAVWMYQAGSSEMFGAATPPQDENTAFYPRTHTQ